MSLIKLKLDSLLDITRAISKNTTEDDLYKIFYYTLLVNPQLDHIAMFVIEDKKWHCKFSTVDQVTLASTFTLEDVKLGDIEDEISTVEEVFPAMKEVGFDLVIPIAHKEQVLALVLVSDNNIIEVDEEIDHAITTFVQTVASIIMTAIENKRMSKLALKQEALRKEIEIAREVQRMLLPKKVAEIDGCEVLVKYIPNRMVGGDYYDYIHLSDDEFILCIADVSGKGVPASIIMSNFQAGLRLLAHSGKPLDEILQDLNNMIYLNASAEKFITTFLAKCNIKNKTIEYVNAGHHAIHLYSQNKIIDLMEGSTIIGAVNPLPQINVATINYSEGDVLLMYTDGLLEAKNEEEEDFGSERVAEILRKNGDKSLKFIVDTILTDLNEYIQSDQYDDDLTILSCKF